MMTNVQLILPAQYANITSGNTAAPGGVTAPESIDTAAEYGVVLQLSQGNTQKSGNYAPDGLKVEDGKRLSAEKARMKQESEPCQTCAERKYQDGSDDMGVSFKAPTSVSPAAAASAVRAHEQEHVSRAHAEGREKDMNVQSSVTIHTSICPECKKVYVSGGVTSTRMTPKSEALNAYTRQAEAIMGMLPGA